MGPADPHPWAAVSSPPSPQPRLGSGSLPHAARTLLHSACCPQSPWTTRPACLQLVTQSCVSETLPEGLPPSHRPPRLHTGPQTNCLQGKSSSCSPGSGNGTRREVKTVSGQPAGDFPGLQQRVGVGAGTSSLHSDGDGHLPSLGPLSITGCREVWRVYLCL